MTSERRVVGWVRFDGDEYHDFVYQTEEPGPLLVRKRAKAGWMPVYVSESVERQTEVDGGHS